MKDTTVFELIRQVEISQFALESITEDDNELKENAVPLLVIEQLKNIKKILNNVEASVDN